MKYDIELFCDAVDDYSKIKEKKLFALKVKKSKYKPLLFQMYKNELTSMREMIGQEIWIVFPKISSKNI